MFQILHLPIDYNDCQQIEYNEEKIYNPDSSSVHENQCNLFEELDQDESISAPYVKSLHSNHQVLVGTAYHDYTVQTIAPKTTQTKDICRSEIIKNVGDCKNNDLIIQI